MEQKRIVFKKIWNDFISTKVLKGSRFFFFIAKFIDLLMAWIGRYWFIIKLNLLIPSQNIIIKNPLWVFEFNLKADSRRLVSTWYEDELLSFFSTDKKNIYIDIWSNIWKYVIYCSKKIGFQSCLSFDPDETILTYQKKNIVLNNIEDKVKIFNIALSRNNWSWYLNMIEHDHWVNSLVDNQTFFKSTKKHKVITKRLDDVLEKENIDISKINLIKIDVEGYEFEVLSWSLYTLSKLNVWTRIIMEIRNHIATKQQTISLLEWLNFKIFSIIWDDYIFERIS